MPAFKWSELEREAIDPAHSSATGLVVRGEKIQVALVLYPAGTAVKPHASPQEQVHAILRGRARYRVGREEGEVGVGQAILIRAHIEYAAQILEDLEAVLCREAQAGEVTDGEAARGATFFTWDDMPSEFITPRYSSARGPTLTGARLEVSLMLLPTGTEGKPHRHPNEQIQVVVKGKARAVIGGEEHIVEPGGGILFPANVEHGARIIEDYLVVNCKNIVPGFSVYHARWEK